VGVTLNLLTAAIQARRGNEQVQGMLLQPLVQQQLVRFAEFVDDSEWVRPLGSWEPLSQEGKSPGDSSPFSGSNSLDQLYASNAQAQFEALVRHLLVQYPEGTPPALLRAFSPYYGSAPAQHWARQESPFMSKRSWNMSRRFARLLVQIGGGGSTSKAMKELISPTLNKRMAVEFVNTTNDITNPTHALRIAQVASLGGSEKMAIAACVSILGTSLGDMEEERFTQAMLLWMCTREEELDNVNTGAVMNHLLASFRTGQQNGEPFSLKGKTVNSVLKTARDVQESFAPSGLKNMKWDEDLGDGKLIEIEVKEVLTTLDLVNIGDQMQNCLQTLRGMYKYAARARTRSSSFWYTTSLEKDSGMEIMGKELFKPKKKYIIVFEVWSESKIVHQAEGPGSTYPTNLALKSMQKWAESQDVAWDTWEMW